MTQNKYLALSAVAAATLIIYKLLSKEQDDEKLPPLVKGALPFLGHIIQLQRNPRKFIQEAKREYGPCFRLRIPSQGTIVVVTSELIPEVMKNTKNFSFAQGIENIVPTAQVVHLSYDHKYIAEEISPRAKNPVIYPIKHNFKDDQIHVFSTRIQTALRKGLQEEFDIAPGEERAVNMQKKLAYLVSNISCPCFAVSNISKDREFIKGMADFTNKIIRAGILVTLLPGWLGKLLMRSTFSVEYEMDLIMSRLVPELERLRKEGTDGIEPTFATMAMNMPKEDGRLRSVKDVAYYFKDIALASIHTTSHFATFALHELASRPQLMEELRKEVSTLDELTPESVADLKLMDSFLREVFRCNTDYLGLHHLTLRDTFLSTGHLIPKGTLVTLAMDEAHQDPALLDMPDLESFNAYRFMRNKNLKSTSTGINHLSFGLGSHRCPGRFFAVKELKLLIVEMIMRYDVKTRTGKRAKDFVLLGMTKFPPREPLIVTNRKV
ncbi:hypothetical protein RMATCC62417_17462 [Rhizopus microsporus]|nr:hypothetical protein RMATCC62417_17462 [Rhizopus microsporus]